MDPIKHLSDETWQRIRGTKLPGGSDVQNIYILLGFHQGLIIIKYEKPSECADYVNPRITEHLCGRGRVRPVNAWDVRLPLETSSTFTWEGQEISEGPIGLMWSGLRKWSHDFVNLCADTKAPGCDRDHKEHLDNRWLWNLISAVIGSNHELPRKEQLHLSYSSRPLRQSKISACKDLVMIKQHKTIIQIYGLKSLIIANNDFINSSQSFPEIKAVTWTGSLLFVLVYSGWWIQIYLK